MMKQNTMNLLAFLFVFSIIVATPIFAHEESLRIKEIMPTTGETHHLEVKPESLDGYRLPYMKVTVTIIDQETQENKTVELHPMFGGNFHYGVNAALKPKQYVLRFHLDAPTFTRTHARENQWLQPLEAEFLFDASVQFNKSIKIGSKETQDMKISFEAEYAESMFILEGTEAEHGLGGHQAVGMQTPSMISNIFQIVLYGGFLVVGFALGFIALRYTKASSKK